MEDIEQVNMKALNQRCVQCPHLDLASFVEIHHPSSALHKAGVDGFKTHPSFGDIEMCLCSRALDHPAVRKEESLSGEGQIRSVPAMAAAIAILPIS